MLQWKAAFGTRPAETDRHRVAHRGLIFAKYLNIYKDIECLQIYVNICKDKYIYVIIWKVCKYFLIIADINGYKEK